jgi:tRNA/rRNA methyltransferase
MKSGFQDETRTNFRGPEMEPATKEELLGLFDHLEEALEARGYFRPPEKKAKMVDNLRSVLTRAGFAGAELRVLRGVVTSLDRFTRGSPRGAAYTRPSSGLAASPSQRSTGEAEEPDCD